MKDSNEVVNDLENDDIIGDNHLLSSLDTPLREDAFDIDDDLKIELIQKHLKKLCKSLD